MQMIYLIFVCVQLCFVLVLADDFMVKNNSLVLWGTIRKKTALLRTPRSIFRRLVIFPGTKWCGLGDVASHINDFGWFIDTDKCCRDHDLCEPIVLPKETKYGIKNKGRMTMLSCSCDLAFHSCLKSVDSRVSRTIGNTYFNLMHRECFYFDTEKETYGWMEVPNFSNSSIIKFLAKLSRNPFRKDPSS